MIHFSLSNYTMASSTMYSKTSKHNYIYQDKFCLNKKHFLHVILSDRMSTDCLIENSDTEKHHYNLKGSGLYQKEK